MVYFQGLMALPVFIRVWLHVPPHHGQEPVTGRCQGDPVALEFPQKWSLHLSQTGHHPTVLTNVCLQFNEQPAYSLNTSVRP